MYYDIVTGYSHIFFHPQITPLTSLDLDSAWFAGPGCVAFAAAERAIPCAMQILGAGDGGWEDLLVTWVGND